MKILKYLIGLLAALTFSPMANATIIDTANDSFIDQNTGLEWMDFGINNGKSFNYVSSHLDSDYLGWRLVSQEEAVTLWSGIFSGYPGWRAYDNPLHPELQGYTTGMVSVNADGDVPWLDLIDIMGYNVRRELNPAVYTDWYTIAATGMFASDIDPDGLGYALFGGWEGCPSSCFSSAQVVWSGGISHSPSSELVFLSTLLVRDSQPVPEPSIILLFGIGLLGLGYKCKVKRKM